MADNGLKNQKVIGVAFDGTGLGTDGKIWGGEFLLCDYRDFQRAAHLKEVPLLGAEKAISEPWRLSAAWLYAAYKDKFPGLNIDFVKKLDKKKWQVLKKMYLAGFNSPPASSMGRLFDAVGSLVLEKYKVRQEAELAVELERLAMQHSSLRGARRATKQSQTEIASPPTGARNDGQPYTFDITRGKDGYILDPLPMFRAIVQDLKEKALKEKIALRFHITVAEMARKTCRILRKEARINKVVLSGGVFQNNLLLRLSSELLYKDGFAVFTHRHTGCNDSGIALGQALIASARS
jgi:hydrogenase maturation protein HypF